MLNVEILSRATCRPGNSPHTLTKKSMRIGATSDGFLSFSYLSRATNVAREKFVAQENGLRGDPRIKAISDAMRVVPYFSNEGIMFQDIRILLLDQKAFKYTVDIFVGRYRDKKISVAVERALRRERTWAGCGPCWQYPTNTRNMCPTNTGNMHRTKIQQTMWNLRRIMELQASAHSTTWSDVLSLYFWRAKEADRWLARMINNVSVKLCAAIEEYQLFTQELEASPGWVVNKDSSIEYLQELVQRDEKMVQMLQALEREVEERADEKLLFIEKLKGNVPFE
ncbi:hypothetical protein Tco_1210251 [Tanacetum coccineum]